MNLALQSNIYRLQDFMRELPQVEPAVIHHFSDGIYARELHIPAGVCLVGALHATKHLFTVSSGKCVSVTGAGRLDIEAPYMGETLPGMKRVIHALTDTVWTTFHVTDETDIDKIAEQILVQELD